MRGHRAAPAGRLPAEFEPHASTWLAWPPYVADLPDEWDALSRTVAAMTRAVAAGERVEVICADADARARAAAHLGAEGSPPASVRLHVAPFDRLWMRDVLPMGVLGSDGRAELLRWHRRAWDDAAEYPHDPRLAELVARVEGVPLVEPARGGVASHLARLALDGGAVDVDGAGSVIAVEEHLLGGGRDHNPGFARADWERLFADWLGARRTIWLGRGCAGDRTCGHVDNVARFVAPGVVVLAAEPDPRDANHERSADNRRRLERAGAGGRPLRVVTLPFPRPLASGGERLPASYANFYIANRAVLVPTFDDPNDEVALGTLAALFPDRAVVGVPMIALLPAGGTIHCLAKQQPPAT